jgi:hypothetical protein
MSEVQTYGVGDIKGASVTHVLNSSIGPTRTGLLGDLHILETDLDLVAR